MHGGGDARRGLNLLGGEAGARKPSRGCRCSAAAVDGGNRQHHNSKIAFIDPGLAMTFMRSRAGMVL